MPLWLSASLGAILRYFLTMVGTYLVGRGIWTSEVADTFIQGAAIDILSWGLMFGPLLVAIWRKRVEKIEFVNALLAPANTHESEVKAMPTPDPAAVARVTGTR